MNWIPVQHFPIDQDLAALTQYLRDRGLQHRITEEAGQQCLAVVDAAVIPALQEFLRDYEQGVLPIPQPTVTKKPTSTSPDLWTQALQVPIVTALIVLSGLGALMVETSWGSAWVHYFTFQDFGGSRFIPVTDSLAQGQIWRLLTPAFLHFGLFHVLFNSLWMWDLGRRVEFLIGRWHFLLFFVLTGIAANYAQFWWSGHANFGGMSGVVYALFGFIAIRQQFAPHPLMAVSRALIGFMLFWLVLCMSGVVDYFIGGSVANAAHLGGLVAGVIFGLATKNLYRQ